MSLTRIRTNTQALRSYSRLQRSYRELALRRRRLATGTRINSAADDSAGFSIASRLEARTRGQTAALANIGDARSMMNVAEEGMSTQMDLLQKAKELATRAASDTMGRRERRAVGRKIQKLVREVEDVVEETDYNGKKLLTGEEGETTLQVGTSAGKTFGLEMGDTSLEALGIAKRFEAIGTDLSEDFLPKIDTSRYTGDLEEGRTFQVSIERIQVEDPYTQQKWWITTHVDGRDGSGMDLFKTSDPRIGEERTTSAGSMYGVEVDMTGVKWQDFWQGDPLENADNVTTDGSGTTYVQYPEGQKLIVRVGGKTLDVMSAERAGVAVERLERAIGTVSEQLATVGTMQQRLGFKEENLATQMNAYASARSRIVDADVAKEQLAIVKQQILQQAGQAALTQANRAPRAVLSLLGGGTGPGALVDAYG